MGDLYFDIPLDENKVNDPYGSRGGGHHGIDYEAKKGKQVMASERGKVVRAALNPKTEKRRRAYGNVIVIDHTPHADKDKRHIYTLYAHLDRMDVSAGDIVYKGQVIGASGDTGTGSGPHLHFEVLDVGQRLGWSKSSGAMGVPGGEEGAHYRRKPGKYFGERTTIEGTVGTFTAKEKAVFNSMIETEFKLKPWPMFKVSLPEYREYLRKIGRDSAEVPKPPPIRLTFLKNLGKDFSKLFPKVDLRVNGKTIGRIQKGTKVYEIDTWKKN